MPLTRRLCGLFALSVWCVSGHSVYLFSDEQEQGEEPLSASLCRFLLTIRSSLADSVQEILLFDIASSSSIGFQLVSQLSVPRRERFPIHCALSTRQLCSSRANRRGQLTFSRVVIFLPLSSAADICSSDCRGLRRGGPFPVGFFA